MRAKNLWYWGGALVLPFSQRSEALVPNPKASPKAPLRLAETLVPYRFIPLVLAFPKEYQSLLSATPEGGFGTPVPPLRGHRVPKLPEAQNKISPSARKNLTAGARGNPPIPPCPIPASGAATLSVDGNFGFPHLGPAAPFPPGRGARRIPPPEKTAARMSDPARPVANVVSVITPKVRGNQNGTHQLNPRTR